MGVVKMIRQIVSKANGFSNNLLYLPLHSHITRMKHSYHTDIALQYKLGILDGNVVTQIPSSTLHNWKHKDFSALVGAEYAADFEQNIRMVKAFLSKKHLLYAAKSIYFIYSAYAKILGTVKNRKRIYRQAKSTIICTVERVKQTIGIHRALRAFDITYQQYYAWKRMNDCKESPFNLCRKQNFNQLTTKEVSTIKSYLNEPNYLHWNLTNVYYQMLRDKAAFMSLNSFYKYANLLFIRRSKIIKKKSHKGIRADAPLRILHMDVTIYRPLDNTKVYIYILMDNYSRYILNWKASLEYSSKIALENLHEAYEKYNLEQIHPYVDLVTDGGSENKGEVSQFIKSTDISIRRLIAQKDIIFSNSMVEAVNKMLKYDFLFTVRLNDFKHTLQYLPGAIDEYCSKPHSSLYGLTPKEVAFGMLPDKRMFQQSIRKAAAKRSKVNLNQDCLDCFSTESIS